MIIRSKAPLRLGLAGGGSDVSPYSDLYGGLVLNVTINLYAYCTIEETIDNQIVIHSYDNNFVGNYSSSKELEIDGNASLIKGVYNRVIKEFNLSPLSFKITTYNDAPAGSGLGTSSTMVVCILKAFVEWLSLPLGDYEVSRLAYEIERIDLKLSGGKQDQYAAAFGGFNYMEFLPNDLVIVNPLKIIDAQKKNTASKNHDAVSAMHEIKQGASDMKRALLKGDILSMASLLRTAWENKKKQSSQVTNSIIERAMEVAIAEGALAGKVSGAGGGGFIMFLVDPIKKTSVEKALSKLEGFIMPFSFTDGGVHGWKIYPTDDIRKM